MSAPTVIQSAFGSGFSGALPFSITVTPSAAITTGNSVIVYYIDEQPTSQEPSLSVTDNAGNTYTEISGDDIGTILNYSRLYFCSSIVGSPTVITISTGTNISNFASATLVELSPCSVDQHAFINISSNSTSWTGPSITTTSAAELLLGFAAAHYFNGTSGHPTYTAGAGWTAVRTGTPPIANGFSQFTEQQTVSSIGTYNSSCTLSLSKPGAMYTISFQPSSGPPPPPPPPTSSFLNQPKIFITS